MKKSASLIRSILLIVVAAAIALACMQLGKVLDSALVAEGREANLYIGGITTFTYGDTAAFALIVLCLIVYIIVMRRKKAPMLLPGLISWFVFAQGVGPLIDILFLKDGKDPYFTLRGGGEVIHTSWGVQIALWSPLFIGAGILIRSILRDKKEA